jgi:aryl sulfotransferase
MKKSMPQRTRTYQNHHIDSLRWDHFKPRNDDIVIATPYKSGTTWMQGIVGSLILPEEKDPTKASPWIDNRVWPIDEVINDLEEQTHRRFIKTHLLLDGLIYYPQIKYIVVGRDARDVFMSLWNHYRSFTPLSYERFNNTPGRVGDPFLHYRTLFIAKKKSNVEVLFVVGFKDLTGCCQKR